MLSSSTRYACAACGAFLLAIAAILIRSGGPNAVAFLPAFGGFAMLAPATLVERDRMAEAMRQLRSATFLCFTFAVVLFAGSMWLRSRSHEIAEQAASIGVAFWAVAMLLAFGAAWFWSRSRRSA